MRERGEGREGEREVRGREGSEREGYKNALEITFFRDHRKHKEHYMYLVQDIT